MPCHVNICDSHSSFMSNAQLVNFLQLTYEIQYGETGTFLTGFHVLVACSIIIEMRVGGNEKKNRMSSRQCCQILLKAKRMKEDEEVKTFAEF